MKSKVAALINWICSLNWDMSAGISELDSTFCGVLWIWLEHIDGPEHHSNDLEDRILVPIFSKWADDYGIVPLTWKPYFIDSSTLFPRLWLRKNTPADFDTAMQHPHVEPQHTSFKRVHVLFHW